MLSLYDDTPQSQFSPDFADKIAFGGLKSEDVPLLAEPTGINLAKTAARYSDGIILGAEDVDEEVVDYCKSLGLPILPFDRAALEDGRYVGEYSAFYDQI